MVRAISLLFGLPLLVCFAAEPGIPVVSPEPNPVVLIDKAGNGTLSMLLKISGKINPALLTVTEFTHDGYPLSAQSVVSGVPADPPAGDGLAMAKIAVSQLWETGTSTAQLKYADRVVCPITARKDPSPFTLTTDPPNTEVLFGPGETSTVTLVNADRSSYRFEWRILMPNRPSSAAFDDEIAPGAKKRLDLSKAAIRGGFGAGLMRDELIDGVLQITPKIEAGMAPQPGLQLPLKMRLRGLPRYSQQIVNLILTAFFVFIGMAASLLFRYYIPNASAALKVKKQIRESDQRLRGMGDDLPSQARTVLESTLASCRHRLQEIPKFLPAFANLLTEVQASAKMCRDWVDCSYKVAEVLGEANRELQRGMPPTLMRLIDEKCDEALHPFLSGYTTDEELQTMKEAVKDAACLLDAAVQNGPVQELEEIIRERETRIDEALKQGNLAGAYPQYAQLFAQAQAKMAKPLVPAFYRDRDTLSLKIELLLAYYELAIRAGAVVFPPAAAVAAAAAAGGATVQPPAALQRLAAQHERFMSYVNTESYQSLKMAGVFISEMQQDFYTPALAAELLKPEPAVDLHFTPTPIEPRVPVHYTLRFLREPLNQVAALQEWFVRWTFTETVNASAGTPEARTVIESDKGWDIYHRFRGPGEHRVAVELIDVDGKPVPTSKPIEKVVVIEGSETQGKLAHWKQRLSGLLPTTEEGRIELFRFAFVLVIALIGVFTTAQNTVEKLGLLEAAAALIGLGFAADTIKNVISDRPTDK